MRPGPHETAATPSEGRSPPRSWRFHGLVSTFHQCQRWVLAPTANTSRRPAPGDTAAIRSAERLAPSGSLVGGVQIDPFQCHHHGVLSEPTANRSISSIDAARAATGTAGTFAPASGAGRPVVH